MGDGCCTPLLYGDRKGHVRRWDVASDLVDHTWQNKNHVFPVQGPSVTVAAVRYRAAPTRS
jgi:hypothetical protein